MSEHAGGTRGLTAAMLCALSFGCSSPTAPPSDRTPYTPDPGFDISFGEASTHTVVPGEVLAIVLKIEREEGFEGVIDLEASATPGFVVIFRPRRVTHREGSDLLVVADQSTPRRRHTIQFTAKSEGQPDRTTTLAVTVVDSK